MVDKPTDFNDAAQVLGRKAVSEQLQADLKKIEALQADDGVADGAAGLPPEKREASGEGVEWRHMLERDGRNQVKGSVRNVALILQRDDRWAGVLGFCELSYRIQKLKPSPCFESRSDRDLLGEWGDEDTAALRVWMAQCYGTAATPTHTDIADALLVAAKANPFHPVRDYLAGLVWDGEPRLRDWLVAAFDSTDPLPYLQVVGPKVLVAAVARVMQPGCKMDNVMILEGEQGRGKSTVLAELFGQWFADAPIPIGDKEAYQLIHGKWAWELAELDSFNKAEVTSLKQFFSQRVDRFRPSYGRYAQDHERQTQFWGTTNQDTYLRDYTGNRRFWPVRCVSVNLDWVKQARDQLWAEALHVYNTRAETGFTWWVSADNVSPEEYEAVVDAQDARLQRDPWEDVIREFLGDHYAGAEYTSADVLKEGLGLDAAHMQQAQMNRVGPIMRALGWSSVRRRKKIAGRNHQYRVWVNNSEPRDNDVPF